VPEEYFHFETSPMALSVGVHFMKNNNFDKKKNFCYFVVREMPVPVSSHQSLIRESLTQKLRNKTSKNKLTNYNVVS